MATRLLGVLHWTQRHLLWLLLATYALGAVAPSIGLRLRAVSFGTTPLLGNAGGVTLPVLMLGLLLVVAGLGARLEEVRQLLRRPQLFAAAFAANALYPVAFAASVALLLGRWHNHDEAQSILVGLAMIGAMPIAGSSTAWSQNADGNVALSLGLVWSSTVLSPLVTPLGLHGVALVAHGDYAEDLHELAHQGSTAFVVLAVVAPSLLGIVGRAIVGAPRIARVMPALKLLNVVSLLVLNYSNASVSLPQAVAQHDWDFLLLALAITSTMCAGAFAIGWWLPRLFHADRADRISVTFGLGMNNNGTGLVLAAAALADHKLVLLPIIFYNLVQQMAAGVVDALGRRHRTVA